MMTFLLVASISAGVLYAATKRAKRGERKSVSRKSTSSSATPKWDQYGYEVTAGNASCQLDDQGGSFLITCGAGRGNQKDIRVKGGSKSAMRRAEAWVKANA